MAATLQRKSSGGINFVIITKIITKENVPMNYFVIISARMVFLGFSGPATGVIWAFRAQSGQWFEMRSQGLSAPGF